MPPATSSNPSPIHPPPPPGPRSVWWFSDGKPGHVSQVRGLVNALRTLGDFTLAEFDCARGAAKATRRRAEHAARGGLTAPPLILGAGRRTHRAMRAAGRQTGGLTVVLMNPVWPTGHRKRGFDLYVVPEHDAVAPSDDVIQTVGALNPLTADGPHDPSRGVMLIGGPSRRYRWDGDATLDRLRAVVARTPGITGWAATSSRRTPDAAEAALSRLGGPVDFTPAADTPRGWVADELADAGTAWVTEDSVSMVFEALTAGCRVGLLPLPRVPGLGERFLNWGPNRVTAGVHRLVERGLVTRYDDWAGGAALVRPDPPLAEAQRVAGRVWARWTAGTGKV